jgi:hypothetical protein
MKVFKMFDAFEIARFGKSADGDADALLGKLEAHPIASGGVPLLLREIESDGIDLCVLLALKDGARVAMTEQDQIDVEFLAPLLIQGAAMLSIYGTAADEDTDGLKTLGRIFIAGDAEQGYRISNIEGLPESESFQAPEVLLLDLEDPEIQKAFFEDFNLTDSDEAKTTEG